MGLNAAKAVPTQKARADGAFYTPQQGQGGGEPQAEIDALCEPSDGERMMWTNLDKPRRAELRQLLTVQSTSSGHSVRLPSGCTMCSLACPAVPKAVLCQAVPCQAVPHSAGIAKDKQVGEDNPKAKHGKNPLPSTQLVAAPHMAVGVLSMPCLHIALSCQIPRLRRRSQALPSARERPLMT